VVAACQAQQKRWTDLDATLSAAERATPGNLGAHYQAARMILAVKGDPARAEALLRRYLSVEPEIGFPSHAGAHWRLGQALEMEGKKPEAIAEMQTAVKLDGTLEGAKQDLKRLKG
jgi:predicted Zn-dependent protease